MQTSSDRIKSFEQALLQTDRLKAAEIFSALIGETQNTKDLEFLTIQTLDSIGKAWDEGTISLAQVYMSGVICEDLMDQYIIQSGSQLKDTPRIAISVLLDHHTLGKRIVYSIIRAGGFNAMDLGQGLSVDEMVSLTLENQIDILLISVLMMPTALQVKDVVERLRSLQYTGKVVVGGAPFRLDDGLWKTVGADATGDHASDIVSIIQALWEGGEIV